MASSPATDLHSPSGLPLEGILLAEELLDLAERAQAYTNAAGVAIALRRGQELLVRTSTGAAPEVGSTIPMSDGFITDCLKSRRPLCCRDTESDSRVGPLFRAMRTRSLIAIPICEHRDAKGVMMVIAPLPNAFQPTHTAILMTLSDIIASKLATRNALPEMDIEIANVPTPAPVVSAEPVVQPEVSAAPIAMPEPLVAAEPVVQPVVAAAPVAMSAPVVAAIPAAKPAPVETAAAAPASVTPAPKPTKPASPFFGAKPLATEPATTPAPAASGAVPAALLRTAPLPLPEEKIYAKPDPGLLSPSEDPTRFKPVGSIAPSTPASWRPEPAAINLKPVVPVLKAAAPTASAAHPAVFTDALPTIAAWEAPAAETSKRPMLLGAAAVAAAFLVAAGVWVFRSTSNEVAPPAVSVPAPVAASLPPAVAAAAPAPVAVKGEAHPKPAVAQPEQPKPSQPAESVAVEPRHQSATPVLEIAAAQPKPKQEPEPEMAAPKLAPASNDAAVSSISKLPVALPARPKSELVPATLISRTAPAYPSIARQMGVFGAVLMNVTISPQGSVTAVRVISGATQLRQAAISAVRQWRYKPAMLNGQPAESTAEVQINFTR
ncbi:MAG: TonB family protein [Terriglobales bacterium]